jgi:hypothetical protein
MKTLLIVKFSCEGVVREWHEAVNGRRISEVLWRVKDSLYQSYPGCKVLSWTLELS